MSGCSWLLWFGRTNAEDGAHEEHIRPRLWLAGIISAVLMLLPLWWFVRQVLSPLREMMRTAQIMSEVRADTLIVAPGAMPELSAYADAFNRCLSRNKALTDEQRTTQAAANLLDNALAYTPSGGTITLALSTAGDHARIMVRDTGPGLRADETEKIWQRHTRGSAASASTPGMGLGLSLVRAIAIAHGGRAGGGSIDPGGAEFWIELPAGKVD